MYKTELHVHSVDASECARADVHCLVERYTDLGYSTLVLTNHFASFSLRYLKCDEWEQFIDKYIDAYKKLKKAAKGKLEILLGVEIRLKDCPNDYLLYGITEEFLKSNPYLYKKSIEELYNLAKENEILVIQAHPFRNNMQITPPHLIDGIEVHNGSLGGYYNIDSRNDIAELWAEKFGLIKTSGSDFHTPMDKINSGIITKKKIKNLSQLIEILKSGDYQIIKS